MPKIDLGYVLGPAGPRGEKGDTGIQGPKGDPAKVNGVSPDEQGNIILTADRLDALSFTEEQNRSDEAKSLAQKNLFGTPNTVTGEFISRISTHNYLAKIKKLTGKSAVVNQLCNNGNFASTSGWNTVACSLTVSNNVASILATGSTGRILCGVSVISGHKYYIHSEINRGSNSSGNVMTAFYDGVRFVASIYSAKIANAWQTVDSIFTSTNTDPSAQFQAIRDESSSDFVTMQCRNAYTIDLTLIFGSGNEPTTVDSLKSAWLAKFGYPLPNYIPYNSGSVVDTDIKGFGSTGKNLFNKETVTKDYYVDNVTGKIDVNTNYCASDYMHVKGASFVTLSNFTNTGTSRAGTAFYDGNKNYISGNGYSGNAKETFAVPNNAVYLRATITPDKLDTAQIEVGNVQTEYEPYNPYFRNFPIILRSAGNVADTVEDMGNGYKVTRRVGSVDLGSLAWTYMASSQIFVVDKPDMMSWRTKASTELVCGRYKYDVSKVYTTLADKECTNNNTGYTTVPYLFIKDLAYTDPTAFKTAMSGVYLNYELATPIVEYHDYNLTYPVTENGTEYFDSPISVPCEIEYGIDALTDIVKGVVGGDTERDCEPIWGELLWENASPNSSFGGQVVNVDLTRYSKVLIVFHTFSASDYAYSSGFYEVGQRGEYSTPMGTSSELAGSLFVYKRCMAISSNSITFENCNAATGSSTFSVDNRGIIPYRIYGIK